MGSLSEKIKHVYKPILKSVDSLSAVKGGASCERASNSKETKRKIQGQKVDTTGMTRGEEVKEQHSLPDETPKATDDGVLPKVEVVEPIDILLNIPVGTPLAMKAPIITSMVKSFRAFSKAKRGVWLHSDSNRFVSLMDEDSKEDNDVVEESSDSCILDSLEDGKGVPLVPGAEGTTSHLSSC